MSNTDNHNEIKDDEIRVISQSSATPPGGGKRFSKKAVLLIALGVALIIILTAVRMCHRPEEIPVVLPEETGTEEVTTDTTPAAENHPYTSATDTTAGGTHLTILTPHDATPVLAVGNQVVSDSSAALIVQAADVRADNGEIVGAFVVEGNVMGRGEKKGGFCAIIDGKVTIGVAESTPLLEEAIDTKGYFFRQYPLVVAGQVVENKPKGRALRKALADLDGTTVVVLSRDRLTFHEFSQALVDLGVNTAIYLVGASGYCSYHTESGLPVTTGYRDTDVYANLNFIVWK